MVLLFNVGTYTKRHRITRHVRDHVVHLGCVRHSLWEENEMTHKQFKCFYNTINRHIESLAPRLLTSWVDRYDRSILSGTEATSDIDCDIPSTDVDNSTVSYSTQWKELCSTTMISVQSVSGMHYPIQVVDHILQLRNGNLLS